jgi:glycosyltransferase involved in cell wall biosynthesis
MASPGLVSTIIPVLNRAALLSEAVASVLAQTYRPIEIVIVDDGSTDDTAAVADAFAAGDPDVVRVIHQANRGVGAARETGRLAARGDFIQYLDSDDVLLPKKFELQVAGLRDHPECGASYGFTRWRHADGTVDSRPAKRTGEAVATMFPAMLEARLWDTPAPLYRAALVREAGPWLDLRAEEDWELDARMAAIGVRLHHCPQWVCEVRRHETGHLSGRFDPDILRDRARAHEAILRHAQRAGIQPDAPEMCHFARELFLLARQCGAAGLADQSRQLFDLAREASGDVRSRSLQFRAYRAIASLAGWTNAGRLAAALDKLRQSLP